jgi:hypothetical protein
VTDYGWPAPVLVEIRCGVKVKGRPCRRFLGSVHAIPGGRLAGDPLAITCNRPDDPWGRIEGAIPSDFAGSVKVSNCPSHTDADLHTHAGRLRTANTVSQYRSMPVPNVHLRDALSNASTKKPATVLVAWERLEIDRDLERELLLRGDGCYERATLRVSVVLVAPRTTAAKLDR